MKALLNFLKKQVVLVVAWILAIVSAFFVHPDGEYWAYIDWRSLGILWSLMAVMAAFRINGVFETIGKWLLSKVHKIGQLVLVLVLLCFILSMFVTNDVALITFVPFAILILEACNCQNLLIPVIVLQTIAANLGSMLTPIGNPQNLYLFEFGSFELSDFIKVMLPYSTLSLVLLLICVFFIGQKKKGIILENTGLEMQNDKNESSNFNPVLKLIVFSVLFVSSILTVLHIIPFYVLVPVVLIFMFIFERKSIVRVDYSLLFTFIGFFIFTGNIARIDFINEQLQYFVGGRELLFGIVCSQVISNVPAALLLSGFSTNISKLIVGINLGGLGTLIASMASLISYKIYATSKDCKTGKYIGTFTIVSLVFLAVLVLETFIFG